MKNNNLMTTRNIILGIYLLAFLVVILVLGLPFSYLLPVYAIITLALLVKYFSNALAVAGNIFYARGDTDKGIALIKKALDMNTTSPAAHLNYAVILVKRGEAETALPYLQKALELKPKIIMNKNIRLAIGSCYWVMGDIDRAIVELESLRKEYEYVNSHVLTTLGYMYLLKGDINKAVSFTEQAIEDMPESGAAWDNMGQIRYRLGEIAQAKEAFNKAIEYNNDLVDSYYHMGLIAEGENDPSTAKQYFQKAAQCKITALNTVTREQVESKLKV